MHLCDGKTSDPLRPIPPVFPPGPLPWAPEPRGQQRQSPPPPLPFDLGEGGGARGALAPLPSARGAKGGKLCPFEVFCLFLRYVQNCTVCFKILFFSRGSHLHTHIKAGDFQKASLRSALKNLNLALFNSHVWLSLQV